VTDAPRPAIARVWIVPVDLPPEAAARCREVLDDSERARAGAFLSQRDRQQYTVAHGALRIIAARELQVAPSALRWDRGPYGKPALAAPWSGLSLSLSHSAGLVAVAIAVGRAVGVDIQHLVPRLDVVAMSARFFPPAEAAYVATGRDAGARADRFTRLWSRKEAVVKAAGGRLWPNLGIAVLGRAVVRCAEPPAAHRVADVPAPAGFRAAVALAGAAPFVTQAVAWPGAVAVPAGAVQRPLRRWHPLADGRENAVPQPDPGGQREVDRVGALGPLGGVIAAEVGQHLHGHRRVLLGIDLNVTGQVIDERAERPDPLVDVDHLLEHVRDQVLAAEGERGGLRVHGRVLDEIPG
jgi:4'-phosphopantetheinyl transferase